MRRLLLLALLLAFPLCLYIEAHQLASGKDLSQPTGVIPQVAPLTEVEALRVQNVNLERVIVQRALDDWQKKVLALKADLEKSRSGWEWNPETGQWTAKPDSHAKVP